MGDVDGNGTDDIVICKEIWTNNDFYSQSDVYRFNPQSVGIPANQPAVAKAIILYPNYPNPFNPSTTIRFTLPAAADVALSVLNIRGQVVAEILDKRRSAGEHSVVFDASVLPSGVYFCRMVSGSFSQVHKMVVVK
ncbi:MAG: T9SS type A sorting domain-containing protein [Calditrichae bacterium]|nr:T9SS type A sorting domain-containing protein [Calditrichia bacterium]